MHLLIVYGIWLNSCIDRQGFIQDFTLGGRHFIGIVNICMRKRRCTNNALLWGGGGGGLGACPPPPPPPPRMFETHSCPEIEPGGFRQLANYPTLVFHFNTCKCILEQELLCFKVNMLINIVAPRFFWRGGISQVSPPCSCMIGVLFFLSPNSILQLLD